MALDSSGDQPNHQPPLTIPSSSSAAGVETNKDGTLKLRRTPNTEHQPESYENLPLDFPPPLFTSLERYLPEHLLNSTTVEQKATLIKNILNKYSPEPERTRFQRHKEYKDSILSSYKRLHEEIYTLDNHNVFAPSFLKAVVTEKKSLRSIMVESSPGIFTFKMFNSRFCKLLLDEVEHMEKWVYDTRTTIMRPNTMNRFGFVLDDFGFDVMLQKLVDDFISPISKVLFPEVSGSCLDSHHGFIVEYGKDKDIDLGFHVDDAEVSLNVCLGKQFSDGELYFRGVRCEKHVNTKTNKEEVFDYSHVPGHAVLHRGSHRHGARATTAGHRVNLILWCRSSSFREMKNYVKDFSSWCGECKSEKQIRRRLSANAAREVMVSTTAEKTTFNLSSRPHTD